MKYNIILASVSPRRQQILKDAGFTFVTKSQDIEEIWHDELANTEVAEYLASLKANAINDTIKDNELVITADTVVIFNDMILGKPKDRRHAISMLQSLSGQKHTVITGVCLKTTKKTESFSVHTDVYFKKLSDYEIAYYVDNYKPYDKAGSYGIQEWIGLIAIERIDGSFYNVMGLPIHKLYEVIQNF